MSSLASGETLTRFVDPHPRFVPSGLAIAAGQRYEFHASGQWRDWFRIVDANGWNMPPLHYLNRVPGAAFFCLCGCVNEDEDHAFAIGTHCHWTVPDATPAAAELKLFANDMRCMYFNNHALPEGQSPLKVDIRRLA